ncbi:MAG: hypothetical protein ACXWWE_09675 [Nitrospira sp.]
MSCRFVPTRYRPIACRPVKGPTLIGYPTILLDGVSRSLLNLVVSAFNVSVGHRALGPTHGGWSKFGAIHIAKLADNDGWV